MGLDFLLVPGALTVLFQVILIDLALAADNAIIIGSLAAGLSASDRHKVIMLGMVAALLMRIGFALIVVHLLGIVGVRLAGGLLLLWVCFKMYREIHPPRWDHHESDHTGPLDSAIRPAKSLWGAAWAVAVADLSMSLDNVLAVAGAASDHEAIMVIGLVLSVIMMGVAANFIARLIERHRWLAWIGLLLILYVAIEMIFRGGSEVAPVVTSMIDSAL